MNEIPDTNTLGDGLAVLRRRWPIVVVVVAICVALAAYHQASRTASYKATADVTFDNSSLSQEALAVDTGSADPTRDGPTNVLVATSLEVADAVKTQLRTSVPASVLVNDVSAQVAPNANVLQITASTGDPALSARLANAFARQYINFETSSQIKAIDNAQADLQRQLDALPANSPDRATIGQSIQRLTQLRAVADGGSQIISPATPPSRPSGASTPVIIVIGLLIGLAIAFTIVFLLETLDRRIGTPELFRREYRLPLLATIPAGFGGGDAASRDDQLEPFRILRTAIYLSTDRPIRTLLVTSAVTGEGKTTVAVDLAHAEALTGRRVTVIELDLRRPTFSRHFSLEPRRGFTSVVAGDAAIEDVLVQPLKSLPNLSVLPSGALPVNPAELLQSSRTAEVITELVDDDGIVIIDSPPLNPVADAHVLLSSTFVDAAIVVARSDFSTREEVRRARTLLDRQLVQPLGIVVTGASGHDGYGYGYGDAPVSNGSRPQPARRIWSAGRRAVRTNGADDAPKRGAKENGDELVIGRGGTPKSASAGRRPETRPRRRD